MIPCTPARPIFAVQISVLELVAEQSLNAAPNEGAWGATIFAMLQHRGQAPVSQVRTHQILFESELYEHDLFQNSLRKRLAKALGIYQLLTRTAAAEVQACIESSRQFLLAGGHQTPPTRYGDRMTDSSPPSPPPGPSLPPSVKCSIDSTTPLFERDYVNSRSKAGHVPEQHHAETHQRPSAYLRQRCEDCFSGHQREDKPPDV